MIDTIFDHLQNFELHNVENMAESLIHKKVMSMLEFELDQKIKNIFLVVKRLTKSENPAANRKTCHDTELFQNLHLSSKGRTFVFFINRASTYIHI